MTILQLNRVALRYANQSQAVLDDINYVVHPGDFIILLGSNGSGKSTLLKLLHRHHQPNTGSVHFLNKPISDHAHHEFSQQVAVLTQNCHDSLFTSLTLYENYLLTKNLKVRKRHNEERQFIATYLSDFNVNLCGKLDTAIDQLSGGEKQAFALALCLLHPPKLLLLDEHTSALDPKTSENIMALTQRMVEKHRITCVLTTHDLDIALKYGNRVLILKEGRIHKMFDEEEKPFLNRQALMEGYY